MTADPTPAPPWTPEMPLRADASDEQIWERWNALATTRGDKSLGRVAVVLAREFARARQIPAPTGPPFGITQDEWDGVAAYSRAPLVHAQEPVAWATTYDGVPTLSVFSIERDVDRYLEHANQDFPETAHRRGKAPLYASPPVAGAPTHEPIQVGGGRYTCPKCGESYHGSEYHECPSTGAPS